MVKLTEYELARELKYLQLSKKDQSDVIRYRALHSKSKAVRLDVGETRKAIRTRMSTTAKRFLRKYYNYKI